MRLKTRAALVALGAVEAVPRALTEPVASLLALPLFLAIERRATLANLARVYPDMSRSRRSKLAYDAYRQMARGLIEFLQARQYSQDEILERVSVDDEELLVRAFREGKGIVLLTAHMGNWEWVARRGAAGGYKLGVISKRPRDPHLGEWFRELQAIEGYEPIEFGETRAALRWLKNGGMLGIVMDQEPARLDEGAVVPLLGRPTLTHTGSFRLARMTGAPVFTAFAYRVGRGRYRVRAAPFELSVDPDPQRALSEDAARFNARLEAVIHEHPDQWLWMYGRWRRLEKLEAARAGA